MNPESRIQITPGVVFSATVFTPVPHSRCPSVRDRDTQHPFIRQSPTLQEGSVIFSGSADRRIVDLRNPHLALSPFSALPVGMLVTNGDLFPEAQWRASSHYPT
ncbi:hypothetical protein [Paraburkholderia oxyphila]|uniref:hypothetical protein n=1 Tax=Paraburkholderia oxyphila TaxID=614212 RepID=UPI0012ED2343|nr:hypothetical protein [Paraburkholderia oxyphila]